MLMSFFALVNILVFHWKCWDGTAQIMEINMEAPHSCQTGFSHTVPMGCRPNRLVTVTTKVTIATDTDSKAMQKPKVKTSEAGNNIHLISPYLGKGISISDVMQEQKHWNDCPRGNLKKEKIFWIGSSDNHGSSRNSTHLSPIKEKIRDVQLQKWSPSNLRRPTDVFKRENKLHLAAVEGATCSLQEKSKNQERLYSAQFGIRQKIDATVGKNEIGEFCPSYSGDVQHLTTGKSTTTVHNNKVSTQAPSLTDLQPLTPVQKFGSTTLHLYLPTASYEEEESNTSRNKNEVPANKDSRISKNVLKIDPLKPLIQNSSRRMTDKRTRVPCKEALSTANLSLQFCGDNKGLYSAPFGRSLIDNTRNGFLLGENANTRNPTQRPVSNVGYRLGSCYSDKIAESSEFGLNVSTLRLSDDKPKGSYLLNQRRGLDKTESFLRTKKDIEINEQQSTRSKSQSDILDFEKRKTYI